MIAVGYCRASSDKQERSVGEQRQEIEKYCKAKQHNLLRWYTDDGWEGDDHSRPAFRDLMRDATSRSCDFELVVVFEQGRFSRFKPRQAIPYFNALEENGITLESITDGTVVDPNAASDIGGELKTYVNQISKSKYLEDLSDHVCRGKIAQGKRGVFGGQAPYGTRYRADGRLERHPVTSKILICIFQWLLSGLSQSAICRRLNQAGIPSPFAEIRGHGKWWPASIKVIARNPVYYGVRYFGRNQRGKISVINANGWAPVARDRRKKKTLNPNPITPEVPTWYGKPLVSFEEWTAVQAIMDGGTHVQATRNDNSLPLVGILKCGECGAPMLTHRPKRGGKVWEYYRCSRSRSAMASMLGYKSHGGYGVRADVVWKDVVNKIRDYLSDLQIKRICAEAAAKLREGMNNGKASIPETEERLAQLEKTRSQVKRNMVYAVGAEAIGAFEAEVVRISNEIAVTRGQLSALKAMESEAGRDKRVTIKAIREHLISIRDSIDGPDAINTIRSIVREIVVHTVPHPQAKKDAKRKRVIADDLRITLDFGENQGLDLGNPTWMMFHKSKPLLRAVVIRSSLE